jgi:DNA-binding PadR family transcriptional regulator
MAHEPRHSHASLRVLRLFLENPEVRASGADISKVLKIPSGSLYPILFRYERAGWLQSEWEDADPTTVGRPRRRLYKLSEMGADKATIVIQDLNTSFSLEPKWAPC